MVNRPVPNDPALASEPPQFVYSNLSGRPTGPFVRLASRVATGVRDVQAQVAPYAESWRLANLEALAGAASGDPLWIALGDSMTQGVGASAYNRGWVGQLADRLAADGRPHRVINLAVSGARTLDVLQGQLPALRALAASGQAAALVTLLVGSNDLMRRRYRDELAGSFGRLLTALPYGTVVASLPNPRAAAIAVNRQIADAVSERAIRIADMGRSGPSAWKGKLAADHFHPNDVGYAELAEAFYGALASAAD
ncbi:MAG: hydrolase family protein [Frankiales bacterium]|nr:hydrolase family protein [Frankiales bacterium]